MITLKPSNLNLAEFPNPTYWKTIIEEYLASVDLKKSTLKSYRRRLRAWEKWIKINKIEFPDTKDVKDFKNYIMLSCKSSLTCTNYLTAVRSFYKWTHQNGIAKNITIGVRNPSKPRGHRKDSLTIDQVISFLNSIDRNTILGKRDYAICKLLVYTGARGIEVCRANIEDLVKKEKWLLMLKGKGSDSKDQFVILVPEVVDAIDDYLLCRNYKNSNEPLFTSLSSNYSGCLSTRTLRGIVKKRLLEAGIKSKRLTAHSLRHTAITLSILGGANLQMTKELARHTSIDSTLRYSHALNTQNNPAFEIIDSCLKSKT